jgi:hypothetical protein
MRRVIFTSILMYTFIVLTFTQALALTVSNANVSTGDPIVVSSGLKSGDLVYIDRAYTFTDVGGYEGLHYIRLPNGDKRVFATDYLTFTVDEPVTVYVAHDRRM